MSIQPQADDMEALTSALQRVRDDTNGLERKAWAIVGHLNNDPLKLTLQGEDSSSDSNLADLRSKLQHDQVSYCLLRMATSVDMSTTVKFIYVHWMGKNVPFAKKGRYGVVHGNVKSFFEPHHLFIETDNVDELTDDLLIKQLEESSGTRNKVIEGSVEGRQERGFTAYSKPRHSQGSVRSIAPSVKPAEISPELQAAIQEVRTDASCTRWVLGGFENGSELKKPLVLVGKGDGAICELKERLQDNEVMYGIYRTTDTIDDICTVKFVYIYWIGSTVKPLVKGKVSTFAAPVEQAFGSASVSLCPQERDEITEEAVLEKIQLNSGTKSRVK